MSSSKKRTQNTPLLIPLVALEYFGRVRLKFCYVLQSTGNEGRRAGTEQAHRQVQPSFSLTVGKVVNGMYSRPQRLDSIYDQGASFRTVVRLRQSPDQDQVPTFNE